MGKKSVTDVNPSRIDVIDPELSSDVDNSSEAGDLCGI